MEAADAPLPVRGGAQRCQAYAPSRYVQAAAAEKGGKRRRRKLTEKASAAQEAGAKPGRKRKRADGAGGNTKAARHGK